MYEYLPYEKWQSCDRMWDFVETSMELPANNYFMLRKLIKWFQIWWKKCDNPVSKTFSTGFADDCDQSEFCVAFSDDQKRKYQLLGKFLLKNWAGEYIQMLWRF